MPQMAPQSWITLFISSMVMILLWMSLIHFDFHLWQKSKNINKKMKMW